MFTNMLTMGQVVSWIASQSCMHMGSAHKAILCKIMDKLRKIKQAMHDVLRGLYF